MLSWRDVRLATSSNHRGWSRFNFQLSFAHTLQFEGEVPLIAITGGHGLEISRREEQSHAKAEALHVLTWDPDDERLVSLSIPFWLLRRMGRGTINLSEDGDDPFDDLDLTFEDLEWHGPGVILDYAREGDDRVLVWTQ